MRSLPSVHPSVCLTWCEEPLGLIQNDLETRNATHIARSCIRARRSSPCVGDRNYSTAKLLLLAYGPAIGRDARMLSYGLKADLIGRADGIRRFAPQGAAQQASAATVVPLLAGFSTLQIAARDP